MVVETVKWLYEMENDLTEAESYFSKLAMINRNLLISLGCVVLVITPLTIITAKKAIKDIGWDVYKKIGCSMKIQSKYSPSN
jgi:hypothetical protein